MVVVSGPLVLALTLVASSHQASGGVGSIDSGCAAPAARSGKEHPRIFVEVSGAVLPKGRQGQWRELDSESELHKLSEGLNPPNTEAVVRTTRAGTLVSMYFQDSSANWAHVVDYCFSSNGPLVRLQGTFNSITAGGDGSGIRRRRTIYFDRTGAVLQSKTSVSDLDTDKPLAKAQFLDEEDPLYPTVRALPFSSDLLPPPPPVAVKTDDVSSAVRGRMSGVKACYQRGLKANPGIAGKAVGHWTVDVSGKVKEFSWQSNDIKSPVFASCTQKLIESWQFPTRETPATVSFPFVFEGAGADLSLTP
jgi:hypothetical protein